jgi:hypothetical protein
MNEVAVTSAVGRYYYQSIPTATIHPIASILGGAAQRDGVGAAPVSPARLRGTEPLGAVISTDLQ